MNKHDHILMQYETPLPDDFDMEQIRVRARKLAPRFDHYRGLIYKLYGVNDTRDAAVNEYTSIYLWNRPKPMRDLLEGDLFDNYSQAFARPNVRLWLIHDVFGDSPSLSGARFAIRRIVSIPRQMKVGTFLGNWVQRERRPDAILQAIGLDPYHWQLADFSVWSERPQPVDFGHSYSLVHVSLPDAGESDA
jgi:Domain of unknown function (DUF4865)